MQTSASLSVFHFLFCELIQQCYSQYKEDHYLQNLKRIGKDTGFKMFNLICLKRGIFQRPQSLTILVKNIQQKVFKHLFGYQAKDTYSAFDEATRQSCYVIVDDVSIYLSWMPEHLWDTAIFFAGFIESVMSCSGVKCKVDYVTKNENGDKITTQYIIRISEKQYQQWNQA